jgi:DNA-binding response OmpR family regulator
MNILLIEDEEIVAVLLMDAMKKWGQKVVWVTTKTEAELKIEQSRFDLILLDILLPDGFGYEIIPKIKLAQAETGIITMTGYSTPAMERTIREFGITYYMSKPVDMNELKQIIDHIDHILKKKKGEKKS